MKMIKPGRVVKILSVSALTMGITLFGMLSTAEATDAPQKAELANHWGTTQGPVEKRSEAPQKPKKTRSHCASVSQTAKPHCERLIQQPWYVDDEGTTHPNGKDRLNQILITETGKPQDWAIQASVFDFDRAYLEQTGEEYSYK